MADVPDPVDPDLAATGAMLKAKQLAPPDPLTTPVAEVRIAQDLLGAYLAEQSAPVAWETDVVIPGAGGELPCRLYVPAVKAPPPLLVYFHGGGFIYGSARGWDGLMRDLVHRSGAAILNVDYRLAPEHPFPASLTDALAAIRQAREAGAAWGVDATRLAAGGDSAGANLALVAAMTLRDGGEDLLKQLLLFYGVFSGDTDSASWRELGSGTYGLSRAQMEWIWSSYLGQDGQRGDWRVTPLSGELYGLPEVLQVVGSLDPLLDDARALHTALDRAGVANALDICRGVNHGFIRFAGTIAAAARALDRAATALRRL